ncbi:MAG TPA: sigma-70 family RNA polymerase sigma factor [Solirubrobacterales bacterium]|nr:sigma-70 family RNA polymerase sigma factor [Solirubrobacterales bacterium]
MTTVEKRQREDEALIKRFAETRSPAMRDQVVERFMPLARSLASRYRLHSEPFEDILQVANLGLVKAVDGFDPARGTPFPGYAVPTILGELRRHFRDHVWNLRLPRGLQELVLKIDHATEDLTDELGAVPTVKQVAERLELPQEVVLEGLEAANARRTDSLDRPMAADVNPQTVGESLGGDDLGFDSVEAKASIGSADVSEQELEILRMRFVDGMKQKDIAEICGCSQMQISRISRATIWKLVCAVRGEPAGPVPRATGR